MLLTTVLGKQAVVIVGKTPKGTGVANLNIAMSFLKLAATYWGWMKIRRTANSIAGSGSVLVAASHSPIRIFNGRPLVLWNSFHKKIIWKFINRLTESRWLYVLQLSHWNYRLMHQILGKCRPEPKLLRSVNEKASFIRDLTHLRELTLTCLPRIRSKSLINESIIETFKVMKIVSENLTAWPEIFCVS